MPLSIRIVTVPNIVTFIRAAAIPWVFSIVLDNPTKNWWIVAIFALTDNLDGILARLEDRGLTFKKLGFRRSEFGRKFDPIIDKLFVTAILIAGVRATAIPLWVGGLCLVQKAVTTTLVFIAQARRVRLHVSKTGKYGEFATNCGFILLLAVGLRGGSAATTMLEIISIVLIMSGLILASIATWGYAKTLRLI